LVQRLAGLATSSFSILACEHASATAVGAFLDKAAGLDAGHLHDPDFLDRMRRAGEVADERFYSVVNASIALAGGVTALIALAGLLAAISTVVSALVVISMVPWVLAEQRGFNIVRRARAGLASRRRQQSYLRSLMTEGDGALEQVATAAGAAVSARHRVLTEELLRLERPAHLRQFATVAAGTMVGGVLLAVAFAWTAVAAVGGRASPGETAAVVGALSAFLYTTANLANSVSKLLEHGPHLGEYFAFLATPRLLPVPATPARLPDDVADRGVEFHGVTFTYPRMTWPALRDVSFRASRGQMIALVGENGAGKSTVVKLLLRLFDADRGVIHLGGVDVRGCEPADVRDRCGVVFQDFARYQFTVRDAVAMGRAEVAIDDTAIWSALAAAGLDGFVRTLPRGLDSQLGRLFPGGRDVSGGQWQRLALARLFYRQADILILDEPTSALDARGEEELFAELRAQLGRRIAFVSSHRFSTVRNADRILVLHAGALVENGTHDELVAAGGRYCRLFETQAAAYR
jgi:ABC-type multidrug transport system fused ATPase/permease subunit